MWRAYRSVLENRVQKAWTSSRKYTHSNMLIGGSIGFIGGVILPESYFKSFYDNLAIVSIWTFVGAVSGAWWPIAIPVYVGAIVKHDRRI